MDLTPDGVRYIGTAISLAGAVIGLPGLLPYVSEKVKTPGRRAVQVFLRWWRRQGVTGSVTDTWRVGDGRVLLGRNKKAPVEEQLDHIWAAHEALFKEVGDLSSAVASQLPKIEEAFSELRKEQAEERRQARIVGFCALPLVAAGIFVSGLSTEIAGWVS